MIRILFEMIMFKIAWIFMNLECEPMLKANPLFCRNFHDFVHGNQVNSQITKTCKENILKEKKLQ